MVAAGVLAAVVLAMAGWFGWSHWQDYRLDRLRDAVKTAVQRLPDLKGYPIVVDIEPDLSKVSLSGLTPSPESGARLQSAVRDVIDPVPLEARLAFVSTEANLRTALADLRRLTSEFRSLEKKFATAARADALESASGRLEKLVGRVDDAENRLSRTGSGQLALSGRVNALAADVRQAVKRLDEKAERIALRQVSEAAADLERRLEGMEPVLRAAATRDSVSGVSARTEAQGAAIARLKTELGKKADGTGLAQIADGLAALRQAVRGVEQGLASTASANSLDSLTKDVGELRDGLKLLGSKLDWAADRRQMEGLRGKIEAVEKGVGRLAGQLAGKATTGQLVDTAKGLRALGIRLDRLESAAAGLARAEAVAELRSSIEDVRPRLDEVQRRLALASSREAQDRLAAELRGLAERAAGLERGLSAAPLAETVVALRRRIDALSRRLDAPRRKLAGWVRSNAIFFEAGSTQYVGGASRGTLEQLAKLMLACDARLRIVGYTDPAGQRRTNEELAIGRARQVRAELVSLGVPGERLLAVGRPDGPFLASEQADAASNRRVEFEIAFEGEREVP